NNTGTFSPDPAHVVSASDVQWTIPSIAASGGTATETYTATISEPSPYNSADTYVLDNTATIVDCIGSGPCSASVATKVPGTTPPPNNAPDLIVAKSVSATLAKVGQTVTYTITIDNIGTAPATDVVMTDVMSGTATFSVNDSSFSGNPPVTVTGSGTSSDPFTWTYSTIPVGAVDTVTYQATILGPGTTSVHGSRFEQLVNTVTATTGDGCTSTTCTSTVTTTAPLPPHGVLGATTTKKTPPTKPAGGVLGASTSTPGTGAHLDLLLTIILVLAGLSLIGLAVAARRQANPQV
ncbi:MAG: CARDB domain-containing protein, partial [Candidatus Dormibacteria bacterium]